MNIIWSYIVNAMDVDDLAMQGLSASAAAVLTSYASAPDMLNHCQCRTVS